MGWQSTVVISNDFLGHLEDPEFGKNLQRTILHLSAEKGPLRVHGYHGGMSGTVAQVIEQHHIDEVHLLAVGDGAARDLGYVGRYTNTDVELLKSLADKLGYRIVRKSAKSE